MTKTEKTNMVKLDWETLSKYDGISRYDVGIVSKATIADEAVKNLIAIAKADGLAVETTCSAYSNKSLYIDGKMIARESYGSEIPRGWWNILESVMTDGIEGTKDFTVPTISNIEWLYYIIGEQK